MEVDKFETLVNLGLDDGMILKGSIVYGFKQITSEKLKSLGAEDTIILYSGDKNQFYRKLGSIKLKDFNRFLKPII